MRLLRIGTIAALVFLALAATLLGNTSAASAGIAIVGSDGQQIKPAITYGKSALVIGVSNYRNAAQIGNAARDAALISNTFTDLGFEVVTILNPGRRSFQSAIADYAATLEGANRISAVYFAGHGVQIDGIDYLLPADVDSNSVGAVRASSISLMDAIEAIEDKIGSGGVGIYFIDASRDNPFNQSNDRGSASVVKAGLAKVSQIGRAVLFATSEGGIALDGTTGNNGPFAIALANQLRRPGLEIQEIFRRVRNEVISQTAGSQVPTSYDTLTVKLVLNHAENAPLLPEEPPETKAAKVLYRKADGALEPTYADGSYALLIGVGDYDEIDIARQPWNDLKHVKDELTQLGGVLEQVHGFNVKMVFDPTSNELEDALETFVSVHGPKPNARLMIMMSGHGTTTERYGRKTAWFVPADTPAKEPAGPFSSKALNLRRVEEWSEIMAAKHVLWVFDSCFSGAAIRMIESKSGNEPNGWTEHLHQNPVRRVLTAGSEDEEVPAKSRFTETLIRVLSGQEAVAGASNYITGQQLGLHLKQDVIRYNFKQDLPTNTPQSDTIVIPGENGDVLFSINPDLSAKWKASTAD